MIFIIGCISWNIKSVLISPIFTNSLALCGTIWITLACRVALCNQDTTTQSLFFLKTKIKTLDCEKLNLLVSFIWNSAIKVPRWPHQITRFSVETSMQSKPSSTPVRYSTYTNIWAKAVHRTTQLIWQERGPCPFFASYTLVFAIQLRKKHGKTSVRVDEECHLDDENRIRRREHTYQ